MIAILIRKNIIQKSTRDQIPALNLSNQIQKKKIEEVVVGVNQVEKIRKANKENIIVPVKRNNIKRVHKKARKI